MDKTKWRIIHNILNAAQELLDLGQKAVIQQDDLKLAVRYQARAEILIDVAEDLVRES